MAAPVSDPATAARLPAPAESLIHQARQAYVVVPSRDGPHVTPDLFSWSDGRIWFAVASTTLKAKVLARRPRAGVVVRDGGRSVVLTGDVECLDPRRPLVAARRPTVAGAGARALVRYGVRNAPDLLAFVGDTVTGRLGPGLPPVRVLFGVRATSGAYLENDAVVVGWGDWSGMEAVADGRAAAPPAGGVTAVAGITGAVAVPGRWTPERHELRIAPPLARLVDHPRRFRLGVVVDAYGAPGPAAKQGRLIRGTGRIADVDTGLVTVVPDQVVHWDGVATAARPAGVGSAHGPTH